MITHFPKVDLNKFDGSDPTSWVDQLEHYFSFHAITYDILKLFIGVLYLDRECWKVMQWHNKDSLGFITWKQFVKALFSDFSRGTNI